MIKLTDIIKVPKPEKCKIKFNMNPSNNKIRALDLLMSDDPEWIKMNTWKSKHASNNLNKVEYLIALAQYYPYGANFYMFGGVYKVETIQPEIFNDHGYKLTLLDDYSEYIKRLIIKIDKQIGRDIYSRYYLKIEEQLNPEIYELAPSTKLGHFLGYQNVSLKHKEMQLLISNQEPSWKQALSYVKGVYVITDTKTGKLYIGSASGNNEGIWQRWASYADIDNLSGGNIDFENLIQHFGKVYIIDNFKYSILEIFDTKTKVDDILERENYWKNVLETKKFGMNNN